MFYFVMIKYSVACTLLLPFTFSSYFCGSFFSALPRRTERGNKSPLLRAIPTKPYMYLIQTKQSQKKDKYRRKCKGHHFCLGGRICSIPCRASCFAQADFEEQDEFKLFFQIILVQFILVQFILLFKIGPGKTACAARN